MARRYARTLLAGLALAMPGVVQPEPLEDGSTILAIGDSLTSGVGGSGRGYPERLAAQTGFTVINAGSPGETSAGTLARLPGLLERTDAELVILCIGTNDLLQGLGRTQLAANLNRVLTLLDRVGLPVWLLAIAAPGNDEPLPLFGSLAVAEGVTVDFETMVNVMSNPGLKVDPVHPNAEGYAVIADSLSARLEDGL